MFPSLKGYSYGLSLLLLASLFVFGFGNSGNFFGVDAEAEMLARVLSNDPNVPQVKDEDLLRIYEVVSSGGARRRYSFIRGDLQASLSPAKQG